jgi:Right handed beta helix region
LLAIVALVLFGVTVRAGGARAAELWVDAGSSNCSDALSASQATSADHPWCTVARAANVAAAGDTVYIMPGVYPGSVRPTGSGTPALPIRFVGVGAGVSIDAVGASTAIKLVGVSDISFQGVRVTGATGEGVWVERCARVNLLSLDVEGNPGAGVEIKDSTGVSVDSSQIRANGSAGILELAGTTSDRYTANTISQNGIGGSAYNGDGLQLDGTGALVSGNTVDHNGDPGPYEHGIYTAATSTGWTIEHNQLIDNAGDIKAAGGPGLIRYNRLQGGRNALVLSDNPAVITVEHNIIEGPAQHLILVTAGTAAARARLLSNTIDQTARSTTSGDASAVFVVAAGTLEIRDNVICYSNPDSLGVALWINDASRLFGLASDTNWLCSTDVRGRNLAWNGSRVTLDSWRVLSGQDPHSLTSAPPTFDPNLEITSTNLGLDRGANLNLQYDFLGTPLPSTGPVDIGAYQHTT